MWLRTIVRVEPDVVCHSVSKLGQKIYLESVYVTYLIDPDFTILAFCIRVLRMPYVCILGKVHWRAASTGSIVEEHAIPLFNVKRELDNCRSSMMTYIVFTWIDMQGDLIDSPIADVVTHANLRDNRT